MLISKVNAVYSTERKFIYVSCPRRFGKSMAANMLAAYYSCGCDSAELFAGLKIAKEKSFPMHLNQHYVIRIDVQRFIESERELDSFISDIEKSVVSELMKEFSDYEGFDSDSRLKTAFDQIFIQSGKGFVFIIDEWDCVFRIAKNCKKIQKEYLDFMRRLFKGADYAELEKWYDGYRVGKLHIYNPKSVADALTWDEIQSYWTGTETYEALKVYIDLNFDGLKEAVLTMLGNGRCVIDPSTFQNDMTVFRTKDDVLTLLIHLGYLTYDKKMSEVFIPNREIEQEFMRAVKIGGWDGVIQALDRSRKLLESTWALDGSTVAEEMSAIHNETSSVLKYNHESSLTSAVLMAYYSAKAYYVNPIMELPSGKGFADVVYLPKRDVNHPALIVELKWDKTASGAIRQIKDKGYASWIEGYTGGILLVGINYDKEEKVHECVIEKYIKMGRSLHTSRETNT